MSYIPRLTLLPGKVFSNCTFSTSVNGFGYAFITFLWSFLAGVDVKSFAGTLLRFWTNALLGMSCLVMPGPLQYACMNSPPPLSKKVMAIGYKPGAGILVVAVAELVECNPSLL